ncbi:MAG: glycosyltransferase family 2 protein [Gemmatimonadales bacterium]
MTTSVTAQEPTSVAPGRPTVSVVIPVFNERGTLAQLHAEVTEQLRRLASAHQIVFVDDGSTDGSSEVLAALEAADPSTEVHRFRSNRGKAEALNAAFAVATGDVVVTMDADLQDKPSELPRMLAALDGCDMVSGWKQHRHDPLGKTMPSRFFNWVTSKVSGLELHDFNCGYKAYRAEVVKELDLYGEMHRFIPVLAASRGFRVKEIAVEHAPRTWGKSKYGFSRLFKGAYDLLTVLLLTRFEHRPMHFFGSVGLVLGSIGFLLLTYMSYLRLILDQSIGTRPLFFLGVVLLLAGLQLVTVGLIGELIVRRTRAGRGSRYPAIRVTGGGPG